LSEEMNRGVIGQRQFAVEYKVRRLLGEVIVRIEVDARIAVYIIKILQWTCIFWYPFRRQILAWLSQNIRRFIRYRIEGYRKGRWFWF